ncbi:MAG TPA: helix-turn-helix domain-containing protein [Chloroflexota bacterium]|jgi:repressor LexA
MAAPYTPRQGQYLAFIHTYTKLRGRSPSEAEIATHFMVSPPSAHQMVVTLEHRGLIQRTPGQARSLRVLLPSTAIPDLESGRPRRQQESTAEVAYPHLARWIVDGGWVELGRTDYSRSMARALDEGGIVWEGKTHYPGLEELLRDLNDGIAQWAEKNGHA